MLGGDSGQVPCILNAWPGITVLKFTSKGKYNLLYNVCHTFYFYIHDSLGLWGLTTLSYRWTLLWFFWKQKEMGGEEGSVSGLKPGMLRHTVSALDVQHVRWFIESVTSRLSNTSTFSWWPKLNTTLDSQWSLSRITHEPYCFCHFCPYVCHRFTVTDSCDLTGMIFDCVRATKPTRRYCRPGNETQLSATVLQNCLVNLWAEPNLRDPELPLPLRLFLWTQEEFSNWSPIPLISPDLKSGRWVTQGKTHPHTGSPAVESDPADLHGHFQPLHALARSAWMFCAVVWRHYSLLLPSFIIMSRNLFLWMKALLFFPHRLVYRSLLCNVLLTTGICREDSPPLTLPTLPPLSLPPSFSDKSKWNGSFHPSYLGQGMKYALLL